MPGAAQAALARVILLSDGNAKVGEITDPAGIAALCAPAAENGVSTSTYGFGAAFSVELMVDMAGRGGGNRYYGDTAADLFEPFAAEFDLISALCAHHVRLALTAESAPVLLQAAVSASTLAGEPLAFADARLTLHAMTVAARETLLSDPLLLARHSELAAATLLEHARAEAEHADWNSVERMLAEASQRFTDQP